VKKTSNLTIEELERLFVKLMATANEYKSKYDRKKLPGNHLIKPLFSSSLPVGLNKLECLSLASFVQVRLKPELSTVGCPLLGPVLQNILRRN
jgi:hypothetical protein